MERRDCTKVITEMLKHVPKEKEQFIKDLLWNLNDASYKAPEETIQWSRTMGTLQKHIPLPKEDWEFEVCSIFTTNSVDDLKAMVDEVNELEKQKSNTVTYGQD